MEDPFEQSLGILLQSGFSFLPFTIGLAIALLLMMALLACSALISGSEVAYFSLSPSDKEELQDEKKYASKVISDLLDRPKRLLATILIANNLVNVAIVILSTYIVDASMSFGENENLKFLIQVIVVTFLLLLLGEVIPKVYANKNPIRLANFMSYPLYYLSLIFQPLSSILVQSTKFIDKRIKKKGHQISVNELSHALELTTEEDDKEDDQKILKGIVKFGNTEVRQVMTSRVDVICIEDNSSLAEVMEIILDSGFSRIPVFKENFDQVVGVLYIKDLLPHLGKTEMNWQALVRKPFFVPENKKIDDLLTEFQGKKIHLAVVVDEYGGSSGIVTLEDVLEEIVGEISDEFDDDNLAYSKLDDQNYVFEGKTPLNDMFRVLDIEGEEFESAKGESETLAGFVIEIAGKIPKKNEKVRFETYLFTVEAADKRRVKQVKVTLNQEAVEEQ